MALKEFSTAKVVETLSPQPLATHRPEAFDVLLLDAASRQSLAVARSLGRAGLRVATAECFAEYNPRLPVPGFRSRYSAHSEVLASFATQPNEFAAGVLEFVRQHPTRAVLPASDGSIAALRPFRTQLEALGCRLALPSDAAMDVANDKGRSLRVARHLGIAQPVTRPIDSAASIPSVLGEIGFPAVLKPTRSWASRTVERLVAHIVLNETEAVDVVRQYQRAGAGVLAQQWVGGQREGVTLFMVDGEVRASFAHVEHRTIPALGGASVLRASLPMPADIFASSVLLVRALGLDGLSEVEYRRDRDGVPLLMEINARLAGPIETAMRAGIDFPLMLWQWAAGIPVEAAGDYRPGVRMRWLRGDLRWVRDSFRESGRPDVGSRAGTLVKFAIEFLRFPGYDCVDWRDLKPFLAELRATAHSLRHNGRDRPADPSHYILEGGHHGN